MIKLNRPGLILPNRRRLLQAMIALPSLLAFKSALAQGDGEPEALPPDGLTPVHEFYKSLTSYSDTGKVKLTYQWPGTVATYSHYRFETAFRAPRNFFFRFDVEEDTGTDAYVLWCDGGDFQGWWKATGVHEVYDHGRGVFGFLAGGSPSKDSINILGPNVFPQALLYGPWNRLTGVEDAGEEDINGHACSKFTSNGRQTGVVTLDKRPIVVLVDKESTLVRKIQMEAQHDSPKDFVDRGEYEMEPVANPDLPDERFTFTPPA